MPISITGPLGSQILAKGASPFANVSFSQFGEDVIIDHIFFDEMGLGSSGFYVDVGAFHPYRYSNTALLYLRGWRGINIDPSSEAIEIFKTERPEDISICAGIASEVGELPFYRFEDGAVNSFNAEHRDTWIAHGFKPRETVMVKTSPLSELIEPHLHGRNIDYLNIDAEGCDEVVLATFDFENHKPKVITVEMAYETEQIANNSTYQKLVSSGYDFHSSAALTAIFRFRKK